MELKALRQETFTMVFPYISSDNSVMLLIKVAKQYGRVLGKSAHLWLNMKEEEPEGAAGRFV